MSKASRAWKEERVFLNKTNHNWFVNIFSKKEVSLKSYRKAKRRRSMLEKEERKNNKDFRSQYYGDVKIKRNFDRFMKELRRPYE